MTKRKSAAAAAVIPIAASPNPPAHDPRKMAELRAALAREFEPTGAVEELWLDDVAHLTARIESLRWVVRGHYINQMLALTAIPTFMINNFSEAGAERLSELSESYFDLVDEYDDADRDAVATLMGHAFTRDIDKFTLLDVT